MMHNLNRRKFLQQAAANAAAAIVLPSLHLDRFNNQSYQYLGRITGRALIVKTNQVSGESIIGWANGSTVVNGIQLADNLHLITPPHWTQIGPSFWYQWQAYIYSVTAINTGTTDTVTTFGSLSGSSKWFGGVLAPNGMIYGIPYNSTSVLKIDRVTDTATTFGSLSGTSNWRGGVLAPNGMIYGIPYDSASVLKIDPVTDTATTFTFGSLSGLGKWIGGVLAPNGMIYGIPYNSTSVLKIDPVTDTATTFGSLSGTGNWRGGVLAPNGMIYGIPYDFDIRP